jgi:hypothetical protein
MTLAIAVTKLRYNPDAAPTSLRPRRAPLVYLSGEPLDVVDEIDFNYLLEIGAVRHPTDAETSMWLSGLRGLDFLAATGRTPRVAPPVSTRPVHKSVRMIF